VGAESAEAALVRVTHMPGVGPARLRNSLDQKSFLFRPVPDLGLKGPGAAASRKKRPQPGQAGAALLGSASLREPAHSSDVGSPPDDPIKLCVKVACIEISGPNDRHIKPYRP
jgi:hypothetical protein